MDVFQRQSKKINWQLQMHIKSYMRIARPRAETHNDLTQAVI